MDGFGGLEVADEVEEWMNDDPLEANNDEIVEVVMAVAVATFDPDRTLWLIMLLVLIPL
jgi:hypothetical protein